MQVSDDSVANRVRSRAGEARRQALLDCARTMLEEEGFHDIALSEILRRVGGSKATVVKYFGNRTGLLTAALSVAVQDVMAGVVGAAAVNEDEAVHDLATELKRVLAAMLRFYLQPQVLRTYRDISAASRSSQELALAFYNTAHEGTVSALLAFLEPWRGREIRRDIDLRGDVGRLTNMLRSDLFERALYGILPQPPGDADIERAAADTCRLFLAGIAR